MKWKALPIHVLSSIGSVLKWSMQRACVLPPWQSLRQVAAKKAFHMSSKRRRVLRFLLHCWQQHCCRHALGGRGLRLLACRGRWWGVRLAVGLGELGCMIEPSGAAD